MLRQIFLVIVGFGTMASLNVHGARLEGDKSKDWPANPDKHVIKIERQAADETEKKMIAAAENAKPDKGVWWMMKDGQPVILVTCQLKAPYALTKDALDYYVARIQEYQKKNWNSFSEPRSSLSYKATVAHQGKYALDGKDYKDVYVVKMEMKFSVAHAGSVGGTDFVKTRTVVLDKQGAVLAVDGDKDEQIPEWME